MKLCTVYKIHVRHPIWKLLTFLCIPTVLVYTLNDRIQINLLKVQPVSVHTPVETTTPYTAFTETSNPAYALYNFTYFSRNIHSVKFVNKDNDGKIKLELLNSQSFQYISNPSNICDGWKVNKATVSVLILIKSEHGNFHLRQSIRWFWEKQKQYHRYVRIVFLLGVSNADKNTDVMIEHARYDDVVQGNFIDEYRNLTYKTIMGLSWAVQYCNTVKHILFQNDDFRFNVKNLVKFLNSHKTPDRVFVGVLGLRSPAASRRKRSRHRLSTYTNTVRPPFLLGDSSLVSINIVRKLVKTFPSVKLIQMTDVYLSKVSFKLGISPQDSGLISFKNCKNFEKTIACKGYTTCEEIRQEWRKFVNIAIRKMNFR